MLLLQFTWANVNSKCMPQKYLLSKIKEDKNVRQKGMNKLLYTASCLCFRYFIDTLPDLNYFL